MSDLNTYIKSWSLSNPQALASTFTSEVFKVEYQGSAAVLKVLNENGKQFEARGATVLRYWDGRGAARLIRADEGAHLLEFIEGPPLRTLVDEGRDSEATRIICEVLTTIHGIQEPIPHGLINMERNFQCLFEKVRERNVDDIYLEGMKLAERLLSSEQEIRVLHGDVHHENILRSSSRGWLLIDPQCLAGERTYDLANTLYNPKTHWHETEKLEVLLGRSQKFSEVLKLDHRRILEYAFAYGCLSASWSVLDGQDEKGTLRIAHSIRNLLKSM